MERNRNGYFLYEEKVFGAAKNREQFQKVLEDLQKSDIIYFTNLTRITRSTKGLFVMIDLIRSKRQA